MASNFVLLLILVNRNRISCPHRFYSFGSRRNGTPCLVLVKRTAKVITQIIRTTFFKIALSVFQSFTNNHKRYYTNNHTVVSLHRNKNFHLKHIRLRILKQALKGRHTST